MRDGGSQLVLLGNLEQRVGTLEDLGPEPGADPRAGWKLNVAVAHDQVWLDDLVVVAAVEGADRFHNHRVRTAGAQVQAGKHVHRAGAVVRGNRQVVGL